MRPSGGGVKAEIGPGRIFRFRPAEGFRNRHLGHPPHEIALAAYEGADYEKSLAALGSGVERVRSDC
jgi:hypothetical protein